VLARAGVASRERKEMFEQHGSQRLGAATFSAQIAPIATLLFMCMLSVIRLVTFLPNLAGVKSIINFDEEEQFLCANLDLSFLCGCLLCSRSSCADCDLDCGLILETNKV